MIVKIGDKIYKIQFEHTGNKVRRTRCDIVYLDGEKRFMRGYGECFCSESDNFSKEIGRKISLGRALRATFDTKSQRAYIWDCYRNRKTQQPGLKVSDL